MVGRPVPGDGYALAGYVSVGPTAGIPEAILLRANEDGSLRWVREYDVLGDSADSAYSEAGEEFYVSLIRAPDEGFVLSGPQYNTDDRRAWLLKTDADGAVDWARTYGGAGGDVVLANGMTTTADGDYALVGEWDLPDGSAGGVWFLVTDADGTPVIERKYTG